LFITEDFGLSPFMQGAVVAALLLGAMVGAGFAGPMSDRLGRRRRAQAHAPVRPGRHGDKPHRPRAVVGAARDARLVDDPAAIITFICLAGFIVSFAATWGPVVWVMLPEVLPLSVRGTAMGVAVCLHWFANFLVSQSFPIMLDAWGSGPVFLGYAAVGVLAFLFVKAMVPETKGRSLEEIEADLQRKTGAGEPAVVGAGGSGRFERGASADAASAEERAPTRSTR
jgi:MFS family permease